MKPTTASAALVLTALLGCGGKSTDSPDTPSSPGVSVSAVTVTPSGTTSLHVGDVRQFTAIVQGTTGVSQAVNWTSSESSKVSVSAAGMATAVSQSSGTQICAYAVADATKFGCASISVDERMVGSTLVTTSGGRLVLPGGELQVPVGALSTAITLSARTAASLSPATNIEQAGPLFEFGPTGTTFDREATLKLSYSGSAIQSRVVIGELSPSRKFVRLVPSVVDSLNKTVSGPVDHFSFWGVWVPKFFLDRLTGTITWRVNGCPSKRTESVSCSSFFDDVRAAFQYWNDVLVGVKFAEVGSAGASTNVDLEITLESFIGQGLNLLPGVEHAAASGVKVGFESIRSIWINDDLEWITNSISGTEHPSGQNIFRAVTHEIGHQLGLWHTSPISGPPFEVMSYSDFSYALGVECTELQRLVDKGYTVNKEYGRCSAEVTSVDWSEQNVGVINQPATESPKVWVKNADGSFVRGAFVYFRVTGGDGKVEKRLVRTDINGLASAGTWTYGPIEGPQTLQAYVPGLPGSKNVIEFRSEVSKAGLIASPSSISFSAIANGIVPSGQTVTLTSSGSAVTELSTSTTYEKGNGWLSASLSASATPSTLALRPSSAALAVGTYSAIVSVKGLGATTKNINVELTVSAANTASVSLAVGSGTTGAGSVAWGNSQVCVMTASGTTGSCAGNFAVGTLVEFQATANPGSLFAGWSGSCVGFAANPHCTLGMNFSGAAYDPRAQFILAPEVEPSVATSNATSIGTNSFVMNGTVNPFGQTPIINYFELFGAANCSGSPTQSSLPNLTVGGSTPVSRSASYASAQAGSTYSYRMVASRQSGAPQRGNCVNVSTQALTAIAISSANGSGAGSVSWNGGSICSISLGAAVGVCTGIVNVGATIQLTATATAGSMFAGWSGSCAGAGTNPLCSIGITTVGALYDPKARFEILSQVEPISVTSAASNITTTGFTMNGTVNPQGWTPISNGFETFSGANCAGAMTLRSLPDIIGGGNSPVGRSLAFTGATAAATYSYRMVATRDGGSAQRGSCANVTTLSTSTASIVVGVGAGTTGSGVVNWASSMTCTISSASATGSCSGNFAVGSVITLIAVASPGSTFAGWTGSCSGVGLSTTCNLGMNFAGAMYDPKAKFISNP